MEVMDDFENASGTEEACKELNEEDDTTLNAVKKYQWKQQNHAWLMPENVAAQVSINTTSVSSGDSNEIFRYAPGEGKILQIQQGRKIWMPKHFLAIIQVGNLDYTMKGKLSLVHLNIFHREYLTVIRGIQKIYSISFLQLHL